MRAPPASDAPTLAELVRSCAGDGELLAIGAKHLVGYVEAASVREVPAPEAEPVVLPPVRAEAALIGGLGGASALSLARAAAACVSPGGTVAFVLPTTRSGLKGTAGSLLGRLRGQKPVLLEELCEALLLAGLADITAHELSDSRGTSVVRASVR